MLGSFNKGRPSFSHTSCLILIICDPLSSIVSTMYRLSSSSGMVCNSSMLFVTMIQLDGDWDWWCWWCVRTEESPFSTEDMVAIGADGIRCMVTCSLMCFLMLGVMAYNSHCILVTVPSRLHWMTSYMVFGSSITDENLYCSAILAGGAGGGMDVDGCWGLVLVTFGACFPFCTFPIFLQILSCCLAVASATASKHSSSSSSCLRAKVMCCIGDGSSVLGTTSIIFARVGADDRLRVLCQLLILSIKFLPGAIWGVTSVPSGMHIRFVLSQMQIPWQM